jgi:hypothetical protein
MKSKDTKRTFFTFLPYECSAAEEYLELMAEKGWLLQSGKGKFLKFKKIEPKRINYSVDVLDKISIFDRKDSDVALEYREYCKVAGWNYICQVGKIQIFYTEDDKKTISIHTDEEEKFKSIVKASLYDTGGQSFLTLMFIFYLYMQLSLGDTSFVVASNLGILSVVTMFSLIIINSIGAINFFLWVIKARGQLRKGEIMQHNNYKQVMKKNILRGAWGLIISFILLKLLIFDKLQDRGFNIYLLMIMCILIIITICVQKFINKKRYSKNINMVITIGSILVSTYLILMLTVGTVLLSSPETSQNEVPNEKVSLILMDFGFKENNNTNPYIDLDKSVLAERIDYSNNNENNYLNYTMIQSHYPWVIKFHENRLLSKLNRYGIDLKQESTKLPSNIKVYSDREKRSFVVVSEDKVVDIKKDFSDISDDEFLNRVYKKLFE